MQHTVPEMLTAVSRELAGLANLTTALQTQLSPRAAAVVDIEAVQSLDLLTQTLACLAPFVAQLGAVIPPTADVDLDRALGQICLSALAHRLRGTNRTAVEPSECCELF